MVFTTALILLAVCLLPVLIYAAVTAVDFIVFCVLVNVFKASDEDAARAINQIHNR